MNVSEVFKSIVEGDLKSATTTIASYLNTLTCFQGEVILYKNRLDRLEEKVRKGIIDNNNSDLEKNRITSSLLETIRKLQEEISKASQSLPKQKYTLSEFQDNLITSLGHKYQIEKRISKGARAILFKAQEILSKRNVVIKCITSPDLAEGNQAFMEEVDKIFKIRHRNILKILDVPGSSYPPSIIMNYIKGYDLEKKVNLVGPYTYRETKEIIAKLTDAIHYLHQRELFENSLHPDRIMIDEEGEPVLFPFITFMANENSHSINKIKEHLLYLSPEQLQNESFSGQKESNQFSLGVLAYFLLTGKDLFEGKTLFDIIESRKKFFDNELYREEKMALLKTKHVPDSFIDLLTTLIAEKPENRFRNALDIKMKIAECKIVLPEDYSMLKDSYYRCYINHDDFIIELYNELIEQSKEAQKRFADNPDFRDQSIIFNSAINVIIESLPEDIAYVDYLLSHQTQHHLSIHYYELFFDLLIKKLKQYDFEWSKEIEAAWVNKREAVLHVIRDHLPHRAETIEAT